MMLPARAYFHPCCSIKRPHYREFLARNFTLHIDFSDESFIKLEIDSFVPYDSVAHPSYKDLYFSLACFTCNFYLGEISRR